MTTRFWPLAVSSWGPRERAAAHAVIDGDQHTMGTKVREFETAFAQHVGSRYAVMTNSGSSANLLAVAALRHLREWAWGSAPEAIVPAIAWATTYAPLAQQGFKLVVCDVDPLTLNVDLAQIRAAVSERTALIVGVSILGNPAPLPELRQICGTRTPPPLFFEDNCESLGARIDDRYCGTFGDVGTFSFFYSHHLNTVEGGALVTDNPDLYELAVCLRAHGWTRDLPTNSTLRQWVPGEIDGLDVTYQFILPGYNVRPTELPAAVGLVQLDRLIEFEYRWWKNKELFYALFSNDERWAVQESITGYAMPFGFTLVFRSPEMRWAASAEMTEAGIEHRLITGGSFALHPVVQHYDWRYAVPGGTPHADHAHRCGLFVGNHATDLTEQITKLHEVLEEVIK